jgi:thioredoxin-related protein
MRTSPCIALAAIAVAVLLPPTARAAELILVERAGCPVCVRWNREIAPIYPKTLEGVRAPLHRVDIAEADRLGLAEPVRFTPTFVIVDDGQEVGRITGYSNDDMFWGLLGRLVERLDRSGPPR